MWWENKFFHIRNNRLSIGKRDAARIADEYGTPLFVYSRDRLLSNYRFLEKAFSKNTSLEIRICYAMKANFNREILKVLRQRGAWIDAVSPNEVREARRAGFPAGRILFTGTSVSRRDLHQAFGEDGLTVNIDALEQLELMRDVKKASFKGKDIKVSVRWNPGIGRGFNPKVITAGERAPDGTPVKFGIEEKRVIEAFRKASAYGFIPVGLHQHLGSGWVKEDLQTVRASIDKIIGKAAELEKAGFDLEFLDVGGGFGPKYTKNQKIFPLEIYAAYIGCQVRKAGLNIKAIAVEPGKFLVSDAGVLLLRVEYIKKSYGNLFACVDGGTFNTVPRLAIYLQAQHEILNCSNISSRKKKRITVAGNLCETGDVFGKDILMPLPKPGDVLAVLNAGAYCRSMASRFNLRDIPREITI